MESFNNEFGNCDELKKIAYLNGLKRKKFMKTCDEFIEVIKQCYLEKAPVADCAVEVGYGCG